MWFVKAFLKGITILVVAYYVYPPNNILKYILNTFDLHCTQET